MATDGLGGQLAIIRETILDYYNKFKIKAVSNH